MILETQHNRSVSMLSVTNKSFMLSVIVLNVVILSVTNKPFYAECRYTACHGATATTCDEMIKNAKTLSMSQIFSQHTSQM
jgi:hypothetical protein